MGIPQDSKGVRGRACLLHQGEPRARRVQTVVSRSATGARTGQETPVLRQGAAPQVNTGVLQVDHPNMQF